MIELNIIYNEDCFEINKDYYDAALRRIKMEQSQLTLF